MRAIRFHEYGGPEVLRYEQDVPEPSLAPDAVLVEVHAASVNPIDWKIRSGARQKDFPLHLPAIPGRDVSGIVQAIGADVQGLHVGDRAPILRALLRDHLLRARSAAPPNFQSEAAVTIGTPLPGPHLQ